VITGPALSQQQAPSVKYQAGSDFDSRHRFHLPGFKRGVLTVRGTKRVVMRSFAL
jgi:hypothetical protein